MEKRAWCLLSLVAGLSMIIPQQLSAQMYVCLDNNGQEQYTNMNFSESCRPLQTKKAGINKRPSGSAKGSRQRIAYGRYSADVDPSSYDYHIRECSRRYNVDPYLIKAVIKTESDFDRYALSKHGAQGLMQLMPETARELRVQNPFNPGENIDAGTRYLKSMLQLFNGDLVLSLAAYNAGPTLVKRLQKVPRNAETLRYVKKVLVHYKSYRGSLPKRI